MSRLPLDDPPCAADNGMLLAANASCTEHQDMIATSVVNAFSGTSRACAGIKLFDIILLTSPRKLCHTCTPLLMHLPPR
jgi:hypothetical protein